MLQTLLLILAGTGIGIVTGLLPGLPPDTVIFLSLPLMLHVPPAIVLPLISALTITHSLLNHIPAILIGAPDSGTALSALPGKQLLLEGDGVLAAATGIGLYCEQAGAKKSLCMACLVVPYLLHRFGVSL